MKQIHLLCLLTIIGTISCDDKGFVRVVARVGEDVVLPCSLGPEVDIEPALFDWTKDRQEVFLYDGGAYQSGDSQFQGRVSHFPDKLKNGNASILIRNIRLSDSGNYSCYFPRPQEQRFYIELLVGIVAKPRAMILQITKDQALLQCEVRGAFPKPKISWINSDGTILPATEKLEDSDGLHYPPALTLQTTVTKTDTFRCRVTQQELNHITEAQISTIIFSDETVTGSIDLFFPVTVGCLTGLLLCSVVAGIYLERRVKRESHDGHNSSLHPSLLLEKVNAIFSRKDKRPVMAKPQETREPNEEAEPDEALMTPPEEISDE